MHLNVTIKNVSRPHFSWATLYVCMYGKLMIDFLFRICHKKKK